MERRTTERTAAAVRAELARRKISGSELARHLGWTRSSGWRRISGAQAFTVDELAAVAEYLDVPMSALLFDNEAAA